MTTQPIAVYLTDGLARLPEDAPTFPVLWVVPPGGREDFAFGEIARLLAQDEPLHAHQ